MFRTCPRVKNRKFDGLCSAVTLTQNEGTYLPKGKVYFTSPIIGGGGVINRWSIVIMVFMLMVLIRMSIKN